MRLQTLIGFISFFILSRLTQVFSLRYFMLVNFRVLVKFLIDYPYERMIFFLYKTCHGDFLVIKRQQLKANNHDWISIDHTIVPFKFLNH